MSDGEHEAFMAEVMEQVRGHTSHLRRAGQLPVASVIDAVAHEILRAMTAGPGYTKPVTDEADAVDSAADLETRYAEKTDASLERDPEDRAQHRGLLESPDAVEPERAAAVEHRPGDADEAV